ncbi:hypothetical protein GGR02_001315 [Anoxybacillus voinovskiensis]|uniref:LysM domain-containing protein n=1 Tax=Anoxybacteroides voinovskiense TaxID=230470 RepID=A0A840DPE6_9BACL|nr:LysM domain-containing protein [Anoxybacillus voinovskiensis]MBB4073553.1 hypothetical protein [Anoxybacillus voinovskiensis]GGJ62922.1 hypothetical protein GCM10008982_09910 [Anoxybacillus voinovskiensis]
MKKLIRVLVFLFLLYVVYYDVAKGTLPTQTNAPVHETETAKRLPYQIIEIKAGDTLVSIVEQQQKGPLPVPIDTLIRDFESLNPGVKATALQIGKSYKIPVYRK